ncbi:MAG: diguanylate cyclase [Thiolinea sp.]
MDKTQRYTGQFDLLPMVMAQEQLDFLRQYGVVYFWLHVLAATVLCTLLWMKASVSTVLAVVWYVAVVILAISCWMTKSRFARSRSMAHEQIMEIMQRYRFINMLLCTVWGISGVILFCEEPTGQAIHLCLLIIITLSVWPMMVISRVEFYTQLALLLLPITLMFALQEGLKSNLLSLVVIAFIGISVLVTHIFSQILHHLFSTQQALLEQVHTDPVTQLINRSHFDKTFKTEWRRSAREGHNLSLLLIEIDHFAKVEIKDGTNISDQYLRVITHCLKAVARRGSDTLARYGRAEFVALLPGTELEEAIKMAEQLRSEVEQAQLNNPLNTDQAITVSIGVSSCIPTVNPGYEGRDDGEFSEVLYPAVLLSTADRALQRAKREGYNRVDFQLCGEENPGVTTVYRD